MNGKLFATLLRSVWYSDPERSPPRRFLETQKLSPCLKQCCNSNIPRGFLCALKFEKPWSTRLRAVILKGGEKGRQFCSKEPFDNIWRYFSAGATSILWVEVRVPAKQPTRQRTISHNKHISGPKCQRLRNTERKTSFA